MIFQDLAPDLCELDYGAKASQHSSRNLANLYRFVDLVRVAPFDLACARMLGSVVRDKIRQLFWSDPEGLRPASEEKLLTSLPPTLLLGVTSTQRQQYV